MKIIIPTTRFKTPRILANIRAFYVDHPSDSDPGYVISGRGPHKRGGPKPARLPGGQIDYDRMTPAQRAEFEKWIRNKWSVAPPNPTYLIQIIHGVEADLLTNEPNPEHILLLIYLLRFYTPTLKKLGQLDRVLSLLRWDAAGSAPSQSLRISHLAPLTPFVWSINSDLSALLKHHYPLRARAAFNLCAVLECRCTGEHIDEPHVTEEFVRMFNARWPEGIVLQKPTVSLPIVHLPGHPDTAAKVAQDPDKHAHEGWDFLAEPQQFYELMLLRCLWKTKSTTHVPAGLTDPALRQLAAVPDALRDQTLMSRLREAAPAFLISDEIAVALGCGELSGFEFDVALYPDGFLVGEEEVAAMFRFWIRIEPQDEHSAERRVTGSAVASFGPAGLLSFEDIAVDKPETQSTSET